MAAPLRKNSRRKKSSGSSIAATVILVIIAAVAAGYLILSRPTTTVVTQKKPAAERAIPAFSSTSTAKIPTVTSPPRLRSQSEYPPAPETPGTGRAGNGVRLAIIIDDMGGSMSEARSLAAIKVPLTFAVIPGLRLDKEVAAFAAGQSIETMIHVPLQSHGWPARRLEANGLLMSMDIGELQERMSRFVQQFPGAVGVNNHMGSEFTESEEKMTALLQVLKQHNLFFIDSVTSPESVGLRMARTMGIRSARRQVFLDNEQERGYILGQLGQAVHLARKNGAAIAICHPHPETIATLAAALPGLAAQGVQLVPASAVVR